MPILTAANSKGGSGKSTLVAILACALAESGASVSVIDADPQQTLGGWFAESENLPFRMITGVDENNVRALINEEVSKSQFVLVDVQGRGSRLMSRVIMACDLVLIPLSPSEVDATPAAHTIETLRDCEVDANKTIPFAVVFNRTGVAIQTTSEREIISDIMELDLPLLQTHLHDRQAYRLIFRRHVGLFGLADEVSNLEKAKSNALELAQEVVNLLKGQGA